MLKLIYEMKRFENISYVVCIFTLAITRIALFCKTKTHLRTVWDAAL